MCAQRSDEVDETVHRSSREKRLSERGAANLLQCSLEKRKKVGRQLMKKQNELQELVDSYDEHGDIGSFRKDYLTVLQIYEEFLNQQAMIEELLHEDEKEEDLRENYTDLNNSFLKFKNTTEQWLCKQEQLLAKNPQVKPNDSVSQLVKSTSGVSKQSRISLAKAKEQQRKAELMTRAHALEEKRQLEQEKREIAEAARKLKEKEEEFEIKTEIEICDARAKALEEFEEYEPSVKNIETTVEKSTAFTKMPEQSVTKLNPDAPVWRGHGSTDSIHVRKPYTVPAPEHLATSFPVNEQLDDAYSGLFTMARELKKPTPEIQKFSGNAMDYTSFVRQFNPRISMNTDSYDERMNYLLQFTIGEAHKIAVGYSHLNAEIGFKAALAEFKDRYGDPSVVAQAYISKALEWPSVKPDNTKSLDEFAIFLRECQFAVENVEAVKVLEYSENLKLLVRKLPYYLHDRWRNIVYHTKEKGRILKFGQLVDFVKREAKKANDPTFGKEVMNYTNRPNRINTRQDSRSRKTFATSVTDSNNFASSYKSNDTLTKTVALSSPCIYCKRNFHSLDVCKTITEKPLKDRYAFLKSKGLCFGCLRSGHHKESCKQKQLCTTCNRYQPSILHAEPRIVADKTVTVTSTSDKGAGNYQALSIVPVRVKHKTSEKYIETYAFLDSGSTATFCTESLMHSLNIEGCKTKVNLHTMTQDRREDCFLVRGLEISNIDGENLIELPPVFTQPKLPVSSSDIIYPQDLQQWSYLRNVPLLRINRGVDLLIGVNVPSALQPWDVIPSQSNGPFAVKTAFGWAINGPIDIMEIREGYGTCVFASVNQIEATLPPTLDEQLRNHFDHDFTERAVDDVPELSREEKQFLVLVEKSVKCEGGHYVIDLPFRDRNVTMPNNRKQAEHRLWLLGKRFSKDEKFHQDYKDFMNKIIEKGYAEIVSPEYVDPCDGKMWFLPHHGVHHPQKNKLRVVFDCAARYQGISLNDKLLQGPYLANTLVGTLIRFRQDSIALMGDIESMFYQVRVPPEHARFLRFMWWEDGDINKSVVEYQMSVHLFGATSSPSVCNFALRKTAHDAKGRFNDEVIDTVLNSFYVDDCLKSIESVDKAISIVKDLKCVLSCGGFHIAKWISNSKAVMKSIPVSDWAEKIKDLDLDQDCLSIERALGVRWNAETDCFEFKIDLKSKPPTRRGILSLVSSIYDPLGFLAPVLLQAKCLLQELCRLGFGWDEKLPDYLGERWNQWLSEVQTLTNFKVDRCLKPTEFGDVSKIVLHHFSDACQTGYGVVTYMRLENSNKDIHVALVSGKARVAPLKRVTIPRLELTAATVAVRTDNMLRRELTVPITSFCFWTDSMSVLRYIHNETSRFHTFVANRLTVIHEGSDVSQWRYIPSKLNPGDEASRGMNAAKFLEDERWTRGPDFLWKNDSEWPVQPPLSSEIAIGDPEIKKRTSFLPACVSSVKVTEGNMKQDIDPVTQLVDYYSSWYSVKRAVALLLRVRDALLTRVHEKKTQKSSTSEAGKLCVDRLTVTELADAEKIILQRCQSQSFQEEITLLKGSKNVKINSSIRKLDPHFDNGLLRVGGRMSKVCMPEDTKHPIILPKYSRVSTLILEQIHKDIGHLGRNSVLSRLREKYWIISAPSAVRKVISNCLPCRRLKPKVGSQKMADLPRDRLVPDEPPFSRVGMDYFGPIEVKQKRSRVKRYGVVFTCLNTRAIHLEVADSLDTSSCISALRRFLARRGQCKKILSDNGTNLVGANRELKSAIENWNINQIHDSMLQQNIDWQFNPPAASHFGGIWERMIRSVRQVLCGILRAQVVNDETLRTVLCEVEAILNDRPITKVPDGHGDLEALTPNHLLLLKRNPSLPPVRVAGGKFSI